MENLEQNEDFNSEQVVGMFFLPLMDAYYNMNDTLVGLTASRPDEIELLEGYLTKIYLHSASAFYLLEGTKVQIIKRQMIFTDLSAVYILARSILETYANFYYTYIDSVSNDEFIFRLAYAQYRGIFSRKKVLAFAQESKEQQSKDKGYLKSLLKEIRSTSTYQNLDPDSKAKIHTESYDFNITEMIKRAGFSDNTSRVLYGILSGHAHGGYLAILPARSATNAIWIITIVLALTLKNLFVKYPQTKSILDLNNFDKDLIENVYEALNLFDKEELENEEILNVPKE